eukprot:TRINITY_DN21222_c0_g1_i1.p1 TRINITY_DN21222_c0_g1~~TRINITY_DN21222_c0_g1_i1.p1  ORF type:complete len:1076 (+),score=198.53 TRINITY_DN21222_c0_g1_i1:121-3348(+)
MQPILCPHPWRPGGCVIGGARGADGQPEIQLVVGPERRVAARCSLRTGQVRALAVHSGQIGWGSEDTLCAAVDDQYPVVMLLEAGGGKVVAESRRPDAKEGGVCTCLDWNMHTPSLLAAGYRLTQAEASRPIVGVRVYDLNAATGIAVRSGEPTALQLTQDARTAAGVTGLCWFDRSSVAAAVNGSLCVCDLRASCGTPPPAPGKGSALCFLSLSNGSNPCIAAAEMLGASSALLLWDLRMLDRTPVAKVAVPYKISSVSWSTDRSHSGWFDLLTSGNAPGDDFGFIEAWDSKALFQGPASSWAETAVRGYETDTDDGSSRSSRPRRSGGESILSGPEHVSEKQRSAKRSANAPCSRALPGLSRDERRVKGRVCGAVWMDRGGGGSWSAAWAGADASLRELRPASHARLDISAADGSVFTAASATAPPQRWCTGSEPAVAAFARAAAEQSGRAQPSTTPGWIASMSESWRREAAQACELYRSDISWSIRLRSAQGFGSSRWASWVSALRYSDLPLLQWAWWTWLMRRLQENCPREKREALMSFPGVLSLLQPKLAGVLSARMLLKSSAEEKEEKKYAAMLPELGAAAAAAAEDTDASVFLTSAGAAAENTVEHQEFASQFPMHTQEPPPPEAGQTPPPQSTCGARAVILALAGWGELSDLPAAVRFPRGVPEDIGEGTPPAVLSFERSVAVRILQLKLTEAVRLLQDIDQSAISDLFSDSRRAQYTALCYALGTLRGGSPWNGFAAVSAGLSFYLQRALMFLECSSSRRAVSDDADAGWQRYACVLCCPGVEVLDRLAFACTYLDDASLCVFVADLMREVGRPGRPQTQQILAILLSGFGPVPDAASQRRQPGDVGAVGHPLSALVSLVDETADVQLAVHTVALLAPNKLSDPQVQNWQEAYLEILHRGVSDIARCRAALAFSAPRQQTAATAVCAAMPPRPRGPPRGPPPRKARGRDSWAPPMQSSGDGVKAKEDGKGGSKLEMVCSFCHAGLSQQSGSAGSAAYCRKCKRGYPLCAVCHQVVGVEPCGSPSTHVVWCLHCHHGGHVSCLSDWFSTRSMCPATDCACDCGSLDG